MCLFSSSQGQCECRPHVEGLACDTCKPLYWNLSPDTPEGCSSEKRLKHTNKRTHLQHVMIIKELVVFLLQTVSVTSQVLSAVLQNVHR